MRKAICTRKPTGICRRTAKAAGAKSARRSASVVPRPLFRVRYSVSVVPRPLPRAEKPAAPVRNTPRHPATCPAPCRAFTTRPPFRARTPPHNKRDRLPKQTVPHHSPFILRISLLKRRVKQGGAARRRLVGTCFMLPVNGYSKKFSVCEPLLTLFDLSVTTCRSNGRFPKIFFFFTVLPLTLPNPHPTRHIDL